jgi:hypothetical protein
LRTQVAPQLPALPVAKKGACVLPRRCLLGEDTMPALRPAVTGPAVEEALGTGQVAVFLTCMLWGWQGSL